VTEELGDLIILERSKDRWIPSQYEEALRVLQFGPDSPLLINIFEADAQFFENAYKTLLRQTWRPPGSGYGYGVGEGLDGISWNVDLKMRMGPDERRQLLKESVRIAAEGTGREEFYAVYKRICEPWAGMDPEKAYTTLAVPNDVTDDMLLTVHGLRVRTRGSYDIRFLMLKFWIPFSGTGCSKL
jgi:ubiquitin carboxyl-terminal hydrolase 25/28